MQRLTNEILLTWIERIMIDGLTLSNNEGCNIAGS